MVNPGLDFAGVIIMYKKVLVMALVLSMTIGLLAGCASDGGNALITSPKVKADTIGDEVVAANSKFAFDILRAVYAGDTKGNVFLSPASISTALAMTWNGADKSTKKSMAEVLGFDNIDEIIVNNGFAYLVDMLNRDENGIKVSLANSIWIRSGFSVLDSFKNVNSDYFAAAIEELDFSDPGAADIINKWVKDNTQGLIESIIDGEIHPATVMFLINTIYFKGNWKVEFDPDKTYESDFIVDGAVKGSVDMMYQKGDTLFYDGGKYKMISLPYGSGGMFMDLILPDDDSDMGGFINQFDIDEYNYALSNLAKKSDVVVAIPKFKTEYEVSLNDALIALGMSEPFTDAADFTKINEEGNLFISEVKHKSYIEVNEKGTEAAAVTSVEIRLTAVLEPTEFIADHPFVYTIRDGETGTILFTGIFDTP